MNNNKTLPISLAVVVVLVVGILIYMTTTKEETPVNYTPPVSSTPPTASSTSTTYNNQTFGFSFTLPDTWKGYTVVSNLWEGNPLTATTTKQTGTKLIIRNPKWTTALPYQDIPVMVFTLAQWNSYLSGNFSVSAAPVSATELGRNNMYVFALPPRWNFDYSEGYVEAENIVKSNPLKTFNK